MQTTSPTKAERYADLHAYCAATGVKKFFVAQRLGISRFHLAGLLYPDRYRTTLTDALVSNLSELLNQPESYIRKIYSRAA